MLRKLWRLEGTVGRLTYLSAGVAGFALKYSIDWLMSLLLFEQQWSPFSYWRLLRLDSPGTTGVSLPMFTTLFMASMPFLWFAMAMTLLRLRDVGRSAGWAALLFVPIANVLLFAILGLLPARSAAKVVDRSGVLESALFALVMSVGLGLLAVGVSTQLLASYGVGLFVAVPFSVAYLGAFLHRRRYPNSPSQPVMVAVLSLVLLGGFLLALAWEGLLCLLMAAPLGLIAAMIGAYLGGRSAVGGVRTRANAAYVVVVGLPAILFGEAAIAPEPPTYRVDSTIVINAPIEYVWRNVVSFSDIPGDPEWYFRAGIAYPLRARIDGHGIGAVRRCEFTTGVFVEPIEVWDEPRMLQFKVTSNPRPLQEMSPYGAINAPHLEGFLASRQGRFALRSLGRNRTELTGSTWYQHHLWPTSYWVLWSDAIIHRIHLRVLRHIKNLSEVSAGTAG